MPAAKLSLVPDLAPEGRGSARPAHEGHGGRPLAELAGPGRLVELCGPAQTTAATVLLAEVQRAGETAAWIQLAGGDLYPPDLAAAGIDLEALIVVDIPQASATGGGVSSAASQCRAAELLLRSGAFGLILLDFGRGEPHGASAWQGRLLGLARQHEARVVILRERRLEPPTSSLGPLTSLRLASTVERDRRGDEPPGFVPRTGSFELRHELLKNKSGGPAEAAATRLRGPWGLA